MAKLINTAIVTGTYEGETMADSSELIVYTSVILVEKSADKPLWLDGELTYTVEVSNADTATPGSDVENAVFTDIIDLEIAELITTPVAGAIQRDGVDLNPAATPGSPQIGEYDYNTETGELKIPLGTLAAGSPVSKITFRVSKKT